MNRMSIGTGSQKAQKFTESVIREMTRLAESYDAVNLSQGFPDFAAPDAVKAAALDAVAADVNQYAVTWGAKPLRDAVAREFTRRYGVSVDSETQVTVCCGSTEAMVSTMLATLDPGDEVVVFEPFYENYGPDAILAGAVPRYVTLHEPDWTFDPDALTAAFNQRTRAIIVNSPNNPTGKVFNRDELTAIAELCRQWNVLVITDEIYEHIIYDGIRHLPMAAIDGMADRTITINSLSKTYSVTGWRVGWGDSAASDCGGDSKGARLSDGWRSGALASGWRRGSVAPRDLLHRAGCWLPAQTGHVVGSPRATRVRSVQARWRLLHHDGYRCFRIFR